MARAAVTPDPIDHLRLLDELPSDEDGAVLLFLGVVRNHNEGREVEGLEYEVYREMAEEVLREIVAEATEELGTDRVAVVHRTGRLEVGETSVVVAVASPHRDRAYRASRYVIEEIKKRLPIWKRERYVDGEVAWVRGAEPPRGDDAPVGDAPAAERARASREGAA